MDAKQSYDDEGLAVESPPRAPSPEIASLLRHPRFSQAARLHVRLNLEACERDANIRKIFGNPARHVAFSLIATMSARAELAPGAPLVTQSQVIETIVGMGLSSHGKIESLINRMVDQGLVTRAPHPQDRRAKALIPTQAFLVMDDALCAIHAKPCALLFDDPIVAGIAACDRATTRQMRAAALPMIEGGGAMLMRNPQMLHFLISDGGWIVLFALIDAIARTDRDSQKFEAIAALCGVSRPHVRSLLIKAADYGLLLADGAGLFMPTPEFSGVVDIWIAECLAAFIGCCRLAQGV
jgi:hypothetical protein